MLNFFNNIFRKKQNKTNENFDEKDFIVDDYPTLSNILILYYVSLKQLPKFVFNKFKYGFNYNEFNTIILYNIIYYYSSLSIKLRPIINTVDKFYSNTYFNGININTNLEKNDCENNNFIIEFINEKNNNLYEMIYYKDNNISLYVKKNVPINSDCFTCEHLEESLCDYMFIRVYKNNIYLYKYMPYYRYNDDNNSEKNEENSNNIKTKRMNNLNRTYTQYINLNNEFQLSEISFILFEILYKDKTYKVNLVTDKYNYLIVNNCLDYNLFLYYLDKYEKVVDYKDFENKPNITLNMIDSNVNTLSVNLNNNSLLINKYNYEIVII